MPQILFNNSFSVKDRIVTPDELINSAIEKSQPGSFILIVPTGKLVRHYRMVTIRNYFEKHRKPWPETSIYTLQGFIQLCFSKLFDKNRYRLIPDAYKLTLFEEAINNANLKFFVKKGGKPSPNVIERLANIIYGLKEDGLTIGSIQTDIENAEKNPEENETIDLPRLKDILSIFQEYQKLLGDKLLDYPELLRITNGYLSDFSLVEKEQYSLPLQEKEANNKLPDSLFPKNPEILIYGFSEFKNPEVEFIAHFSETAIPFAVSLDYSTSNGPLFGNLEDAIINLTNSGFRLFDSDYEQSNISDKDLNIFIPAEAGIHKELLEVDASFSLNDKIEYLDPLFNISANIDEAKGLTNSLYLRRWLFNTEKEIKNKSFSSFTKILATVDKIDEVKTIAKLVKHLSLEEKINLSDICIVTRHPEKYSNLFREIFHLYNIPVNISDRYPLAKSPVISAVFAILNIVLKGYRIEDIHKALQSPYLSFLKDDYAIDGLNLVDTALKLRINGGMQNGGARYWISRLGNVISFFEKKYSIIKDDTETDFYDLINIREQLRSTKKAYEDFKVLTDLVDIKNDLYSPQEFADLIKNKIISKFKIREKIIEFYNQIIINNSKLSKNDLPDLTEQIEKDSRALSALIKLLEENARILAERYPDVRFSLKDLVARLQTSIIGERYQIREKHGYGVNVTSIEQTRGITYKAMILCGALDREFPLAYSPETFLGKELPDTELRHLRAERMQFYQFLTNSPEVLDKNEKLIFITYPKTEDTEELVRTPFIDALLKVSTLSEDSCFFDIPAILKSNQREMINKIPWIEYIAGVHEAFKLYGEQEVKIQSEDDNNKLKLPEELLKDESFSDSRLYLVSFYQNIGNPLYTKGIIDLKNLDTENLSELESLKRKAYSITELETYTNCPYKYFTKYILNLPEPKDYDISLSPLELGSLMHKILYIFFNKLQKIQDKSNTLVDNDFPFVPVVLDPANQKIYKEILLKIANELIDEARFDHPYFLIDEEQILGIPGNPGYLETWLSTEINRIQAPWEYLPVMFELGFGMKNKISEQKMIQPVDISDKLKIKGKIDRVEILESETGKHILIADYKSSLANLTKNTDIEQGKGFQVPIYMIAAKKIFEREFSVNTEIDGGVYYSIKPVYEEKSKKYKSHQFLLLSSESPLISQISSKAKKYSHNEINEVLQKSVEFAEEIVKRISLGDFPVEPAAKACDNCNFSKICRINER